MSSSTAHSPSIIHLDIGGKKFSTTVDTLNFREPNSMLAAMFSGRHDINSQKSEKGYIFIDRDGKHFRHILNWLRDGAVPILKYRDSMELLREAEYFQLVGLINEIKDRNAGFLDETKVDLNRGDFIKLLQSGERLQLPSVYLPGIDLSGFDLSGATFTGANLKRANLKSANLKNATLERAILTGANMTQANLSGTNLSSANMEKANLSRADLSGASLHSADLKSANLEEANMKYDTLFANTNLEGTNLVGASIKFGHNTKETNLSRANLDGATIIFENVRGGIVDISATKSDLEENAMKHGITLTGANFTNAKLCFPRN